MGDNEPLKVPLSLIVSVGAGVTASVENSDGKLVAMISAARQF